MVRVLESRRICEPMWKWFKQLYKVLRGDATRVSSLTGVQIEIPVGGLAVVVVLLDTVYGVWMWAFSVIRTGGSGQAWMQMWSSTVQVPMLFFLTLLW